MKMIGPKKQLKITKLFRKGGSAHTKLPQDCEELQQEVQQLEQKLREKQNELFQLQRNSFKKRSSQPKKKEEFFIRPRYIVLNNSVEGLKQNMELMTMLTGVEVQSYVENDHCCIMYHIQHKSDHVLKHGLRIDMNSDGNEVTKFSLPLGFNIKAVMEEYDNIKHPKCLGAIRKALVAYYERLEQYESLTKLLSVDAEMFKSLDSSHIEITFFIQGPSEEDDYETMVTLILDYRVYDIRPKTYSFIENDLPDEASDVLRNQCSVFVKKPLSKAFKEAFMNDIGMYRLVRQCGPEHPELRRPQKRFRPNKNRYNNDDTFLPEECSDPGDDDDHSE